MAIVAALPPRTRRANAFAALEDADSAAEAFHASIDAEDGRQQLLCGRVIGATIISDEIEMPLDKADRSVLGTTAKVVIIKESTAKDLDKSTNRSWDQCYMHVNMLQSCGCYLMDP